MKQIQYKPSKTNDSVLKEQYVYKLKSAYNNYKEAICTYYSSCYIDDDGNFCVPDEVANVGVQLAELEEELARLLHRQPYYKELTDDETE